MDLREELLRRLREIPGLEPGPSRRGHGDPLWANGQELVHFHGESQVDVRLGRRSIQERKARGGFDPVVRTRGPSADWVAVHLTGPDDMPVVVALVREAVRLGR